jgi:undecaprenyl-diphosphatase
MKAFVANLTRWDLIFFQTIFGWTGRRFWSGLMRAVSWSANGHFYPLLALILILLAPEKGALFFQAALGAFGFELPIYKILKIGVKRPRPCDGLAGIDRRIMPGDRFSFPSGHTAAAFLVATLLGFLFPILVLPAFIWASLVGLSRVYLGVHYPTDTLAGMLLGVLSALSGIGLAT